MKQQRELLNIGLVIFIVALFGFAIFNAKAAGLVTVRDYINRNNQSLLSGVTHEVQFRPATAVSGGVGLNSVTLTFPDGDDGLWCRTAGALVLSTASLKDAATALPGATKTATCTQGSGVSSYDTITISGVDNLVTGTTYAILISDTGVGKLGTPLASTSGVVTVKTRNGPVSPVNDVDSSNIALDIIASDQISVSGVVDPTLTFAISNAAIGFGSITAASVKFATNDLVGATTQPANTLPTMLTVSTNATAGAVVEIKDSNSLAASGLYSAAGAGKTIASMASSSVVAGTEGFGIYGKNATGGLTVSAGFDNNAVGDLSISTTLQTLASSTTPLNAATVDVAARAAVSAITPSGSYDDTLTVVATGKF